MSERVTRLYHSYIPIQGMYLDPSWMVYIIDVRWYYGSQQQETESSMCLALPPYLRHIFSHKRSLEEERRGCSFSLFLLPTLYPARPRPCLLQSLVSLDPGGRRLCFVVVDELQPPTTTPPTTTGNFCDVTEVTAIGGFSMPLLEGGDGFPSSSNPPSSSVSVLLCDSEGSSGCLVCCRDILAEGGKRKWKLGHHCFFFFCPLWEGERRMEYRKSLLLSK